MNGLNMFGKTGVLVAVGASALLVACERPPVDTVQWGYRGLGMQHVSNPRTLDAKVAATQVPAALPAAAPMGQPASAVYKNVPVLGNLDAAEFIRLMTAITEWVSPKEGCNYCHVPDDLSSDALYTKVVSRRMLEMTQHSNAAWKQHVGVGGGGVTCYTCHRGQPVPAKVWTRDPGPLHPGRMAPTGQNIGSATVAYTALPFDPLTPFLEEGQSIPVVSNTALPEGSRVTIKQTERTYGLMAYISDSLGVNCTYCHNSRSFFSWDQSTPQRATAWHAIRHVQEINKEYIGSIASVLPASRKGPLGDPMKVGCATCHQGAYKPLYGANLLKDYAAGLGGPVVAPTPVEAKKL